mgnify:CR=1 FL=1
MTERQLASLVQRFEHLATDVVTTHGGRVIKTVGDEILFVHTDPAAAAAIAIDLVAAMGEDELLPDVRVGMAWGSVVSRLGDGQPRQPPHLGHAERSGVRRRRARAPPGLGERLPHDRAATAHPARDRDGHTL